MFAFSAVLASALALTATANAALSPRASPSPGDSYYRPSYTCPTSVTNYGSTSALTNSDYRTDSNVFNCEYEPNSNAFCAYDASTGAQLVSGGGCPDTATATSGCIYECALTETGGSALLEVLYSTAGNSVQCEYWTGSQWLFCLYNNSGALEGSSGESTGHGCPSTASYQCDAGAQRRGYRGVDNYTAWLSRRAARKAREAAPAAPAAAAAPMVRRKYSVNRRG